MVPGYRVKTNTGVFTLVSLPHFNLLMLWNSYINNVVKDHFGCRAPDQGGTEDIDSIEV